MLEEEEDIGAMVDAAIGDEMKKQDAKFYKWVFFGVVLLSFAVPRGAHSHLGYFKTSCAHLNTLEAMSASNNKHTQHLEPDRAVAL